MKYCYGAGLSSSMLPAVKTVKVNPFYPCILNKKFIIFVIWRTYA